MRPPCAFGRAPLPVLWMIACAIAGSTGCTLGKGGALPPASYDLGAQAVHTKTYPAMPGVLLVPGVTAPVWLDHVGIVYRLLYEHPSRPQVYAASRWSGEPAALITDRLRSRFAAVTKAW